jgi:outer membrane protein W
MRYFAMFLLGIIVSTSLLKAQEDGIFPAYDHRIGATISSISGAGLSYMYSFNENIRGKATGYIFYDASNNDDYGLSGSFGLELQKDLHRSSWTRLYMLVGTSIWYEDDRYFSKSILNGQEFTNYESSHIERMYTAGVGLGVEIKIVNHFMLNLDGGYQFRRTTRDITNYSYDANGIIISTGYDPATSSTYIGFGGGIGLCYAF